MNRILTTILALSLLSGTAIMAQPNNSGRNGQNDNRDDRTRNDQNSPGQDKKVPAREAAPAGPRARGAREQAPPPAPAPPAAQREQASRERAASPAPASPRANASRERNAPPNRNVQEQNRNQDFHSNPAFQDLRNRPDVRVATPRWSRGDRIPDQYRQNQYVVSDWRQRGLRQPPRDYHWVRDDNNNFFLALIATGLITESVYRDDRDYLWRQRYSRQYTYSDDIYYQECRNAPDPAGVIVGALIGGLLGNAAGSGGGRTGATVAGIIVGGAVGAALTSNLDCEDRSYAYKSYYDGFNVGRPNAVYRWSNPRNDHRGEFRVIDYYNDPAGFRCSNYSQTVYIQGRPQEARGRACRQPDGTWAIVN
jgi:Ni/Co efflux regulator RcnB/surface antigen